MRNYKDIRDEWIHLRKIPTKDKLKIDTIKQAVLGLVIDKTTKLAKNDKSEDMDKYLPQAIKSEYKQTMDALSQGVDCQDQVDILESLMPKSLSPEETEEIIKNIVSDLKDKTIKPNMGLIMKELKQVEGIDMKIASKLVSPYLK